MANVVPIAQSHHHLWAVLARSFRSEADDQDVVTMTGGRPDPEAPDSRTLRACARRLEATFPKIRCVVTGEW